MLDSLLDYIVCPICRSPLELSIEESQERNVNTGTLKCSSCEKEYPIIGSIPILTPPNQKPFDWFSKGVVEMAEKYVPMEVMRRIGDNEITPVKVNSNEPVLNEEELQEGEYKDSLKFLFDRFGSVDQAKEHFRSVHESLEPILESIIEKADLDEADKILDVGTGYGYMLQYLVEHIEEAELFSMGISYTNLKAVRGRFREYGFERDVHLVVGDAHMPPFPDNQFEGIESFAGFGNVVRFAETFPQILRIMKNEGWFATNISGLELTDRDTKLMIEAVGEDYFIENMRKIGLSISTENAMEEMELAGFRNITATTLEKSDVLSGQKVNSRIV